MESPHQRVTECRDGTELAVVRGANASLDVDHISALRKDQMSGTERSKISPGLEVEIVQKHHQRCGTLTRGVVQDILTKSPTHPHGIKVRLVTGEVGRVKDVLSQN